MSAVNTTSTTPNVIIGTQLPAPALVHVTSPRTSLAASIDPLDAFFGVSSTRESRHDENRLAPSTSESLPEYTECVDPPAYKEPATLAMYLFKFGFLFPPFWILGAFILASSLRAPPPTTSTSSPSTPIAWMDDKTPAEREELIERMRRVEVKWAKRCLYAVMGLLLAVVIAVVAAWTIAHA